MTNAILLVAFFMSAVLSASGLLWSVCKKENLSAVELGIKVAAVLLILTVGLLAMLNVVVNMAIELASEAGGATVATTELTRVASACIRALALPAGIVFFVSLFVVRGDILKAVRDSLFHGRNNPSDP